MPVYVFTGKLGGGKTLCSVGRIKDKIQAGCTIATNIDIHLLPMFGAQARSINLLRVPDKPLLADFEALGIGNASYDESKNGLLCLDECGTWFNSRNWNDKTRKPVNDWLLHARKFGWDVILIIQDISLLDSQAREALAEHTVFCKRLDRLTVPVLGFLWKSLTGYRLGGPRVHVAKAVYGTNPKDLVADRWVYRGNNLFACYDTKQVFRDDYPHAVHSVLTPWHLRGRFAVTHDWDFYMRMTRIYLKRFSQVGVLAAGLAAGAAFGMVLTTLLAPEPAPVEVVQAPVENVAPDPEHENETKEKTEKPKTVVQLFEAFKLISYIQSPKQLHVVIGNGAQSYTREQLESMGYSVSVSSNCEVRVGRPLNPADIAQVFADGCTPRPYDDPALDLNKVPALAQPFASEAVAQSDTSF